MATHRIWHGKKEYAERPYYCGQMWDYERQLWRTVTSEFGKKSMAVDALLDYLDMQSQETPCRQ